MVSFFVSLYSTLNLLLEKIGFKLDYIGSHRYKWIKDMGISCMIDVGANKGQTIDKYKKIFGQSVQFYCFEPQQKAFSLLQKKYGKDTCVKLFHLGLGAKKELKTINIYSHDDSSSFLESTSEGEHIHNYSISDKESIQIDTLDHVLSSVNFDGNILMKIDVQGYELDVITGGFDVLSKVKVLIVELSFLELYKEQPLFSDIYSVLTGQGFMYAGSLEQAGNPENGKPLQQDAIFINTRL